MYIITRCPVVPFCCPRMITRAFPKLTTKEKKSHFVTSIHVAVLYLSVGARTEGIPERGELVGHEVALLLPNSELEAKSSRTACAITLA